MQRMRNYSLGIMLRRKSSCQSWDQNGHQALHMCWIFDCCICYFHWHHSMCTRRKLQHAHVDLLLILCRLCFSIAATMSCCYSFSIHLTHLVAVDHRLRLPFFVLFSTESRSSLPILAVNSLRTVQVHTTHLIVRTLSWPIIWHICTVRLFRC